MTENEHLHVTCERLGLDVTSTTDVDGNILSWSCYGIVKNFGWVESSHPNRNEAIKLVLEKIGKTNVQTNA